MSQEIDPAVWETKLRKLLCEYNGSSNLDSLTAAEFQMCNTLGRLLSRDDEVELHPLITRTLIVTIRERGIDSKPVDLDLTNLAEYIANEYFVESDRAHVMVRNAVEEVK